MLHDLDEAPSSKVSPFKFTRLYSSRAYPLFQGKGTNKMCMLQKHATGYNLGPAENVTWLSV